MIEAVLRNAHPLSAALSNTAVDLDRLDFLIRDAIMTGETAASAANGRWVAVRNPKRFAVRLFTRDLLAGDPAGRIEFQPEQELEVADGKVMIFRWPGSKVNVDAGVAAIMDHLRGAGATEVSKVMP